MSKELLLSKFKELGFTLEDDLSHLLFFLLKFFLSLSRVYEFFIIFAA